MRAVLLLLCFLAGAASAQVSPAGGPATFTTVTVTNVSSTSGTITPIGTTGNQTIDKAIGTINVAAAAAAVTLTSAKITAASVIFTTVLTNDATCSFKSAVLTVGQAVFNMSTACTAATAIAFKVEQVAP